jgi:hypothetical protein
MIVAGDLADGRYLPVRCDCGWDAGGCLVALDVWAHEYPPIPYTFILRFSTSEGGDPDDAVSECPECGEMLDLDTVNAVYARRR